jgi:ABC-type transport system involved in cytochrome bd biosynthesis fused ATPase/permease subunit
VANQLSTDALLAIAAAGGAGAFLGALGNSVADVSIQRRKDRREHERWQRDNRLQTFTDLLSAMSEYRAMRMVLTQGQTLEYYNKQTLQITNRMNEAANRAELLLDDKNNGVMRFIHEFDAFKETVSLEIWDSEQAGADVRRMTTLLRDLL